MDKIFGLSERALQLCEDRGVMLTDNLVNSSTPHYKARDMDFQKALKDELSSHAAILQRNDPKHISSNAQSSAPVMYRVPMQDSLDGNTVDDEIERKNFMENALRYQINLTFIHNEASGLIKAIKGE